MSTSEEAPDRGPSQQPTEILNRMTAPPRPMEFIPVVRHTTIPSGTVYVLPFGGSYGGRPVMAAVHVAATDSRTDQEIRDAYRRQWVQLKTGEV